MYACGIMVRLVSWYHGTLAGICAKDSDSDVSLVEQQTNVVTNDNILRHLFCTSGLPCIATISQSKIILYCTNIP